MDGGSNCESLTSTRGSDRIVTCLAIHSPKQNTRTNTPLVLVVNKLVYVCN